MDMALVRRQAVTQSWERQKLWLWRLHRYSVGGLSIVHGEKLCAARALLDALATCITTQSLLPGLLRLGFFGYYIGLKYL